MAKINCTAPGLAPSGELGPRPCYQTIAWAKTNNVCPGHFSARGHPLGARAKNCLFKPIFRENMLSPFGQPLHCVRISLACNSSVSLPIDVKFSHNVQIPVCIFFLLTRFFGGITPTAKFFSNFRLRSNFRRGTIDVLRRFKLCAGCVHSEQLRVQRVPSNTQPVR